ncbi:hypothetical protein P7C71_g4059, partial [Lecanoromycetidae sp. Uapishka_2]
MESAMNGMADHGYGYNISSLDFGTLIQQGDAALQTFEQIPFNTSGLFNFPLCVVTDLGQLPDSSQIARDYYNEYGGAIYDNPCECVNFNYTVPGTGQVQFFKDYVTQNIIKEVIDPCTPQSLSGGGS